MSAQEYDQMRKDEAGKPSVCKFCHWSEYQSILYQTKYWVWIENIRPYWFYHTMFIPKRHFSQEHEMTVAEMADLIQLKQLAFNVVMDSKLVFPSGINKDKPVEKFVYFHRFRVNRFDAITGTMGIDHFHDHFTPDIDHRWDSTLDEDAYKFPIGEYLIFASSYC